MSAWHENRETWSTTDQYDIGLVVDDRLPDWGLTRLGRQSAARQLAAHNVPVAEIAELVGVSERTVWRWAADGWGRAGTEQAA
ncbi:MULTISPECIES: helix-turn-helix domain-containing protein [unclassified Streptomyces]|uniref:helix-turn-helix domain-containing protein n=1 Tax=unclassified Streptomyces TaxID=2593676 RepID=UPI00278C3AE6|nr:MULTISPECIES: helix-turn-helix domain-containing protein [unclassified Streptomyces]